MWKKKKRVAEQKEEDEQEQKEAEQLLEIEEAKETKNKTEEGKENLGQIKNLTRQDAPEYVKAICEKMAEAYQQIQETKQEYQAVTAYLTDMEVIDKIPLEKRETLDDAARKIISLTKERERLRSKDIKITDAQYKIMERYEDSIPDEILRIQENEKYNMLVRDDMRKLEGEKGALQYEAEQIISRQAYLKRMGILTGIMIISLFCVYIALGTLFETDMTIPFLLTILMGGISALYIFLEARRNLTGIKLTERKMNRAITLLNKVKIKNVNTTAFLDYSYEKYGINNSKELIYRWEQYMKAKDEARRYKQNTDLLNMYNEILIEELKEFQISDAEIWIYQANAIVDKKEMVEIRHRLNIRRKKLRERMNYNNKICSSSLTELRNVMTKYPQMKDEISTLLRRYERKIQMA